MLPSANAKEIRFHKVLDSLAGPVTGDAARLQQSTRFRILIVGGSADGRMVHASALRATPLPNPLDGGAESETLADADIRSIMAAIPKALGD